MGWCAKRIIGHVYLIRLRFAVVPVEIARFTLVMQGVKNITGRQRKFGRFRIAQVAELYRLHHLGHSVLCGDNDSRHGAHRLTGRDMKADRRLVRPVLMGITCFSGTPLSIGAALEWATPPVIEG